MRGVQESIIKDSTNFAKQADDVSVSDNQNCKPVFLFSVDYILNTAGKGNNNDVHKQDPYNFDWLFCTRFKPPKLDRSKKKDSRQKQKRRPGRNPRIPFTAEQVSVLEHEFKQNAYLGGTNDVHRLSEILRLSESRIKIWFQNRRARERRDNLNADHLLSSTPNNTMSNTNHKSIQLSMMSAFKPLNYTPPT
ncbi:homeobox protein ceh-1-like [Daktulosphaira vitifoliae]|uniref:homeobox protein ceh-1-like n=1 Tax=Daktulosphaira vitifoliae TaxID=58002 RepID=UPI0021AA519D|nr:homeobox protein ceh-1-like [Daktulosphaira vitifoliae]